MCEINEANNSIMGEKRGQMTKVSSILKHFLKTASERLYLFSSLLVLRIAALAKALPV